eukprot:gnl/TRDRNA2_/TRDRNA2_177012_c0_seq9.p1 gnl/TRDRNA2_/TRDRNA2_177012_c0~~gnl/TRDRNA2_/TRDRNA2_177012_c0_seq9.p1  ORF type:complete len:714 (+),score=50.79 gnl/TRDRNA2_/TRDRNA2_177012_c0_seq9:311-2143(+)
MVDTDVQREMYWQFPSIYKHLRHRPYIPPPVDIDWANLYIFQAFFAYWFLFVVPFRHGIFLYLATCGVYTAALAACFKGERLASQIGWAYLSLFLNLCAKYTMESSQRSLFFILEKQSREVLNEKIMRCEAEFKSENLLNRIGTHDNCRDEGLSYFCSESEALCAEGPTQALGGVAPRLSKAGPRSFRSLPAIPCITDSQSASFSPGHSSRLDDCECGDCLPADTLVWVEGSPMPEPLHSVSPGKRLLCYDILGESLKYASATEVHPAINSEAACMTVVLDDGSKLQVTSDHPFLVQSSKDKPSDKIDSASAQLPSENSVGWHRVCASDLQEGRDKIQVLKTMPVGVRRVKRVEMSEASGNGAGSGEQVPLFTVTVQQPERHLIFVSTEGQLTPSSAIAVGSCNLKMPYGLTSGQGLSVKNTFLNVGPEHSRCHKYRRSNSAPPTVCNYHSSESSPLDAKPPSGSGPSVSSMRSPLQSISNSTSSAPSEQAITVRVGSDLAIRHGASHVQGRAQTTSAPLTKADGNSARLSELMALHTMQVQSLGSMQHMEGRCNACSFHFLRKRSARPSEPCKNGYMCSYCHHPAHISSKGKGGGPRKHRSPIRQLVLV